MSIQKVLGTPKGFATKCFFVYFVQKNNYFFMILYFLGKKIKKNKNNLVKTVAFYLNVCYNNFKSTVDE